MLDPSYTLADQIDVVEAEIEQRHWAMAEPDDGLRCMMAVLETLKTLKERNDAFLPPLAPPSTARSRR